MDRQKLEYLDKISRELGVQLLPEDEIKVGDSYFGYKNTSPKLLQCKEAKDSFIVPTTQDYCFDKCDCVKVVWIYKEIDCGQRTFNPPLPLLQEKKSRNKHYPT